MNITRLRQLRSDVADDGYAMVLVIGIAAVLMILIASAAVFSVGGLRKADIDQDSAAALAAAYAGVDEYQSRLTSDNSYSRYGNSASVFSRDTGSTVDPLPSTSPNAALGVGKTGTWATVPGSGGTATFRYEIDNSHYGTSGLLRLRSTGKVGNATRTVIANLKAKGFIDYLYFTNYEVLDPALDIDPATGDPKCQHLNYAWASGPARTGCTEITFDNGDSIDGAVRSNDTIHSCKATFTEQLTSSNPIAPFYAHSYGNTNSVTGCTASTFKKGTAYAATMDIPAKNSEMQRQTRVDSPVDVPRPGCQYTGPTSITFNADGTMTVRSPWTLFPHAGTTVVASGVTVPACGTAGSSGLGSSGGQKIAVPANNLIFVQSVPATIGDPNYWAVGVFPHGYSCTGADGTTAGNGIGYPGSRDGKSEKAPISAYGCLNGDAFVRGTLKGRVTVAAANYIYVTGDITYANKTASTRGTDMLGLVGDKAVWVYNPVNTANDLMYTDSAGRDIQAAILSVENTFQVQNYNTGPSRGNLRVFGSIAQNFRGVISQAGGYVKQYVYDSEFRSTAPPKFLGPVATTYGVTATAEVADAFEVDGSPIP